MTNISVEDGNLPGTVLYLAIATRTGTQPQDQFFTATRTKYRQQGPRNVGQAVDDKRKKSLTEVTLGHMRRSQKYLLC